MRKKCTQALTMYIKASDLCQFYIKASESAKYWRDNSIKFMQSCIDERDMLEGIDIKELVEVLIVNGALEIDFIEGDEYEGGDEDANEEKDTHEEYSCSEVECTSSFMSAFLLSTMNQHNDAHQGRAGRQFSRELI